MATTVNCRVEGKGSVLFMEEDKGEYPIRGLA